jgi:hypothetical protein
MSAGAVRPREARTDEGQERERREDRTVPETSRTIIPSVNRREGRRGHLTDVGELLVHGHVEEKRHHEPNSYVQYGRIGHEQEAASAERGMLEFDEPQTAEDASIGLTIGVHQVRRLLGGLPMPGSARIEARADWAVGAFLTLFAPRQSPRGVPPQGPRKA